MSGVAINRKWRISESGGAGGTTMQEPTSRGWATSQAFMPFLICCLATGCGHSTNSLPEKSVALPPNSTQSEPEAKIDSGVIRTGGVPPSIVGLSAISQAPNFSLAFSNPLNIPSNSDAQKLETIADGPVSVTLTMTSAPVTTNDPTLVQIKRNSDGFLLPVPTAVTSATDSKVFTINFTSRGGYEVSLRGQPGKMLVVLNNVPNNDPNTKHLLTLSEIVETLNNTTYTTNLRSNSVTSPIRLNPNAVLTSVHVTNAGSRPVVVVDNNGTLFGTGVDTSAAATVLNIAIKPNPDSAQRVLQALDQWSLESNGALSEVQLIASKSNNPAQPKVLNVSNTQGIPPSTIADISKPIPVFDNYIRLVGLNAPKTRAVRFEVFETDSGGNFNRALKPASTAILSSTGSAQWDAELGFADTSKDLNVFVVADDNEGQNYSLPLTLTARPIAFLPTDKPTIKNITEANVLVPATTPPTYATKSNNVTVRVGGVASGTNLVFTLNDQGIIPTSVTAIPGSTDLIATLSNLIDDSYTLIARFLSGTSPSAPSDPVNLRVSGKGPVVSDILPSDFGISAGPQTLTIHFTGNKLQKAPAETVTNYTVTPSTGNTFTVVPNTAPTFAATYDDATNSVTLKFDNLPVSNYRVTLADNNLVDIFGNKLAAIQGVDKNVFSREFVRTVGNSGIAGLESAVIPPGRSAPFIPYPEFNPPREPTNGFNPEDNVQTRIVRLYFYRDAHRVAQIVNRHVDSYNRVAVDTRRRLANETRRQADVFTDTRRLQELTAVRAAQDTRAAQKAFDQATQNAANVKQNLTAAQTSINPLQTQLKDANDALAAAKAPDPTTGLPANSADIPNLQATANNLNAQLQQATTTTGSAPKDLSSAQDAVNRTQQDLLEKRTVEANASDKLAGQGFQEDRARESQFRLEVGGAHEDPDTFAPGVPNSIDPVEQVSVAVIGEGVIQLRGPIKGINIVRKMINEIDSPAGQVRIAIHTVQINGEHGDRMEKVKSKIKDSIDHARFVTMQSGQMLRNAVVKVASRRAVEAAALCPDGTTQAAREAKYVDAFFGADFLRELQAIDSEFLRSGNKVISLHSMDTTSLAAALMLMSLAKNETRREILDEFHASMAGELPAAELNYFEAGGVRDQKHKHLQHLHHKDQFVLLAGNARFQSLTGFFNNEVEGNDTLTPIQREFIRLAQIFKSRLVTEMQLNERIKERGLIEDRIGNRLEELKKDKEREDLATQAFANRRAELQRQRTIILQSIDVLGSEIRRVQLETVKSQPRIERISSLLTDSFLSIYPDIQKDLPRVGILASIQRASDRWDEKVRNDGKEPEPLTFTLLLNNRRVNFIFRTSKEDTLTMYYLESTAKDPQAQKDDLKLATDQFRTWIAELSAVRQFFDNFAMSETGSRAINSAEPYLARLRLRNFDRPHVLKTDDDNGPLDWWDFRYLIKVAVPYGGLLDSINREAQVFANEFNRLVNDLDRLNVPARDLSRRLEVLRQRASVSLKGDLLIKSDVVFGNISTSLETLLQADLNLTFARQNLAESRRPLDSKKLLDSLISEKEDKYIELLEGTRAHTAVVDGYLKALATALDDDFNTQFYDPAFRQVRAASRLWDVQLAQIEKTSVLTNNRMFAKVSPTATMEFDLPKRKILITEGMNSAKALMDEYGALLNDPTFLSLTKLTSGQPTSSLAQGTQGGGASSVRSVLPELSRSNDEQVLRQAGPGRREFGSALEALIPDPAIYKFETGTGYEIRPVIQPDGQAVTFDFNYMYTTNVREPVRADEKHLGRVKRHFYNGPVQLSNYELREVTDYQVALKASRTSRGVPLLEDVPALGILFRPLPSAESSLQQNVILAQSTIFPTLFDLMGLRWAPAVADLDTLELKNADFIVRGRARDLSNRVYDETSSTVDNFMRVAPSERRPDLYRAQDTIPDVHPNGYRGPGLNLKDSKLKEGYSPEAVFPPSNAIPESSSSMGGDFGIPAVRGMVPNTGIPVESEYRRIEVPVHSEESLPERNDGRGATRVRPKAQVARAAPVTPAKVATRPAVTTPAPALTATRPMSIDRSVVQTKAPLPPLPNSGKTTNPAPKPEPRGFFLRKPKKEAEPK